MNPTENARMLDSAEDLELEFEPPRSEIQPKRARVLIALNTRDRLAAAAITMGRLVASSLSKPLHGLFAADVKVAPTELPRLIGLPPGALEGVVLDLEVGEPVDRIVASTQAHPTAFIVVGAEPPPTDQVYDLGVGSLAAKTIEQSHVPVLIVRPESRVALRRILVPLDGTPTTARAIEPAGDLARRAGASLDIVLVGEAHHLPQKEHGAMVAPQYVDQPHHEWQAFSVEFLHRFLKTLGHCPKDVPTRFFLGAGDPADEIIRFAILLQADLAVLVWHGCHDKEHASVFRRVLRQAPCPILVLRTC